MPKSVHSGPNLTVFSDLIQSLCTTETKWISTTVWGSGEKKKKKDSAGLRQWSGVTQS